MKSENRSLDNILYLASIHVDDALRCATNLKP